MKEGSSYSIKEDDVGMSDLQEKLTKLEAMKNIGRSRSCTRQGRTGTADAEKAIREKQAANAAINQTEQKKREEREKREAAARSRAEKALETKPLGATATTTPAKTPKKNVVDKRMVTLLARLVDERMNQEFSQRDQILNQMKDAMEVMRHELERNVAMLSPQPRHGPHQ